MSDKQRYIFDTNVIISAFLFEQSKPNRGIPIVKPAEFLKQFIGQ